MNKIKLGEIASCSLSNVDKLSKDTEKKIRLCNFVDVYKNWKVTSKYKDFMDATASDAEIEKFKLKKGYIAFTKDSETRDDIGISCLIDNDFDDVILGYHTALVKPDENKVIGAYLNAYLHSDIAKKYFYNNASGSGQRYTLTLDTIENMEIYLPSLDKQRQISNILERIEDQILQNKDMVQKLQVLGKSVFSKTFKDEKSYCSLSEFPYINFLKPGIDKFSGEKRYLATAEVVNDEINYEADKIDYENRESRANMQPIHNSIRFAKMKASIKHIFITEKEDLLTDNYIFSTGFCGFKCEPFVLEYMINYIELPYFEIMKDKLAHGATQQAVNNEDLKSMKIAIPTKEKLEAFHESTKDIYEQITKIKESNVKLNRLKNNLLPLLINGQLS